MERRKDGGREVRKDGVRGGGTKEIKGVREGWGK